MILVLHKTSNGRRIAWGTCRNNCFSSTHHTPCDCLTSPPLYSLCSSFLPSLPPCTGCAVQYSKNDTLRLALVNIVELSDRATAPHGVNPSPQSMPQYPGNNATWKRREPTNKVTPGSPRRPPSMTNHMARRRFLLKKRNSRQSGMVQTVHKIQIEGTFRWCTKYKQKVRTDTLWGEGRQQMRHC